MSGLTIQGNSIFSETTNSSFHVNTKMIVKEGQNTSQTKEDGVETSKDGDTLELSAAGSALAQKTFTATSASAGVVSKDEGYTSKTAQIVSSAAASAGITEEAAAKNEMSAQAFTVSGSSSSSTSGSTSDLSSYTATELKEMLQNGEITKAEYDAEIASRSSSTNATDDEKTAESEA